MHKIKCSTYRCLLRLFHSQDYIVSTKSLTTIFYDTNLTVLEPNFSTYHGRDSLRTWDCPWIKLKAEGKNLSMLWLSPISRSLSESTTLTPNGKSENVKDCAFFLFSSFTYKTNICLKQKKCSIPNQQRRKTDSGSIQLPCIYLKVKNSQRDYLKDMEYIYLLWHWNTANLRHRVCKVERGGNGCWVADIQRRLTWMSICIFLNLKLTGLLPTQKKKKISNKAKYQ